MFSSARQCEHNAKWRGPALVLSISCKDGAFMRVMSICYLFGKMELFV